jgi:2-succinyl-6-hydroxy-2,4-cyclohexadiene-1-carboxylate synthase
MTRVRVNDVSLEAEWRGEGPPLVLLHGYTGSSSTWSPFLGAFGSARAVITVDLLGHGSSDSPPDPGRYRVERCVEDLTALVDHLGIDSFDLLGYSMGGRVALHLALALGNRVRGLILESASPGIPEEAERSLRLREDEALADLIEREGIERFVDHWERLPLWRSQSQLSPSEREELRRQRLGNDPRGLAASLRGMGAGATPPLHDRLKELSGALLIAGVLDEKYVRLAAEMERRIPGSRTAVVAGAGHAVHLERPREFTEIVMNYLDGLLEAPSFQRHAYSGLQPR